MSKIVCFDFDGVLCHTGRAILNKAIEWGYLDPAFSLSEITEYQFSNVDPVNFPEERVREVLRDGDCYRYAEPCKYLINVVRQLALHGFEVPIVSARYNTILNKRIAEDWVARYEVPVTDIFLGVRSSLKHEWARDRKVLAFIEDRPDIANNMAGICLPFLVGEKYNETDNGKPLDSRVMRREREEYDAEFCRSFINLLG
jgi:hypothetical protein